MKGDHVKVRKAVIPAAGLGTRFLPITKTVPKEMLPLLDRPIIQEVIEESVLSGIRDIVLVTGMGKNSIEDYFDISAQLERFLAEKGKESLLERVKEVSRMVDIASIRQKEPKGLGHAVQCSRSLVGDNPFAVLLGDDIIDSRKPCIAQLIEVFERFGKPVVALQEVPWEEVHRYGVVQGEEVEPGVLFISRLVEKPDPDQAPSNLAVTGRYILPPEIFTHLEATRPGAGGEIQLTDALDGMARESGVYGLVFEGQRYDTGNLLGFLIANIQYALKDEELGPQLLDYLKNQVLQGEV
jgi:UTP--glucose-1-phosphate uridylyltransferase